MTLLCTRATWRGCRDSSVLSTITGNIYFHWHLPVAKPLMFVFLLVETINVCIFIGWWTNLLTAVLLLVVSYHILGNAGHSLTRDFYTIDGLAEKLVGSAFVSLDHVPDHRFRPLIHILTFHGMASDFCRLQMYFSILILMINAWFYSYQERRSTKRWKCAWF